MEKEYNQQYLESLAHKYREGTLTEEELTYFEAWYNSFEDRRLEFPEDHSDTATLRDHMFAQLSERIEQSKKAKEAQPGILAMWTRMLSAAAVLFFIGYLVFSYFNREQIIKQAGKESTSVDIGPGKAKAILFLADGRALDLENASTGTIADQAGNLVNKTREGQLVYAAGATSAGTVQFNKIVTPKGGTYQVTLPDGTKVWLNAASSLKYPLSFKANENNAGNSIRLVELTGEGYFEVAKDREHPFIVRTGTQDVKVLGTHFNVNAYNDEPQVTTTLLEGAVEVRTHSGKALLHPGQEASLSGGHINVSAADTATITAWKNGNLSFKKTDIKKILRDISRWYDIEVTYKGKLPQYTLSGEVSRQAGLSAILKILRLSEVHYELQGRSLIITP